MKFKTKVIIKNAKTKYSVDFGICEFMSKDPNKGTYSSQTCNGCYAAKLLNIYPDLRSKLEGLTGTFPNLDDFKSDIQKIKDSGNRYIRFYSLGDFGNPKEIEYIHAAADILNVEAFSKTLHANYRVHLKSAASHPKVNISLSLNKSWPAGYVEILWNHLKDNNLLRNVQLNYTFIGDEKVEQKPYISVYHTTKLNKVDLINKMGGNRVCCAREEDGTKVIDKKQKDSCAKCPLCKLPAADVNGNILVPKLMSKI